MISSQSPSSGDRLGGNRYIHPSPSILSTLLFLLVLSSRDWLPSNRWSQQRQSPSPIITLASAQSHLSIDDITAKANSLCFSSNLEDVENAIEAFPLYFTVIGFVDDLDFRGKMTSFFWDRQTDHFSSPHKPVPPPLLPRAHPTPCPTNP